MSSTNIELDFSEDSTNVEICNDKRRIRSEVWEHFVFANNKAKCKHCIR
jgi:hypothetical protein